MSKRVQIQGRAARAKAAEALEIVKRIQRSEESANVNAITETKVAS